MEPSNTTDYLKEWQIKPKVTALPYSVKPTQVPRVSTPTRVEPGTRKVIDEEVRKRAATLLYALTEGLKVQDNNVQKAFQEQATKDVDDVVADLGFSKAIHQSAGEKLAFKMIDQINQDQDMAELEAQHKAFGAKLEAMKKARQNERKGSQDLGELADVATNGDARNTRGGMSTKRARELTDVEENLDSMKVIFKRMKTKEDARRRKS